MSHSALLIASLVSVVSAIGTAMPGTIAAQEPATGKELADRAFECRQAIPAGIVEWTLTHPVALDRPGYEHITQRYRIIFSDRADEPYKAQVDWSSPKSQWTAITLKTSAGIIWEPGMWCVHASYSTDPEYAAFNRNIHDPRLLGLALGGISQLAPNISQGRRGYLDADSAASEAKIVEVNGTSALSVEYKLVKGHTVVVCYAPDFGFNPIRISMNFPDKDYAIEQEVKYGRFPVASSSARSGEVWFPIQVDYKTISKGLVRHHEHLVVTRAEFGIDLPDDAFEQSSLAIIPGRRFLSDQSRSYVFEWGRLRPATSRDRLDGTQKLYLPTLPKTLGEE